MARNESGMLYCTHIFQPTKVSSLRLKKRRNSRGSQSPAQSSQSEYNLCLIAGPCFHLKVSISAWFLTERGKKRRAGNRALDSSQTGNFIPSEKKTPLNPSYSPKKDATPTRDDHRARFYEDYRKVAEEYDKDFLKKHDEDLSTTLSS